MINVNAKKDSLYWGMCSSSLEECIGKSSTDTNHYKLEQIPEEAAKWQAVKKKFFVCGNSTREKRTPLLWKLEYQSNPEKISDFIGLSP